jgi:hypothetical protein
MPLGSIERGTPQPRELWAMIDPELLRRVAGDDAAADALRRSFVQTSFADYAELAVEEQVRAVERLRALTGVLLERLDASQRVVDGLWLERLLRCGFLALLLSSAALVAVALDRFGPDIARGKTWRASSDWNIGGCKSPQQQCEDSPYYFFHTRVEANPWVELDLGVPSTFTKVRVENREDCCYERAVPLTLEVSDDRKRWNRLAVRKQPFTSWTADVPPTRTRFVRLRVEGQGPLHLDRVRIQP